MSYRVIRSFYDLQDNSRMYRVGDTYPRAGFEPSAERIEALETGHNANGQIYIKKEGDSGNGGDICNNSGHTNADETSGNAGARKSRKSPGDSKLKAKDSSK